MVEWEEERNEEHFADCIVFNSVQELALFSQPTLNNIIL